MFDSHRQLIPPDLEEMEPGPVLAAILSGIDVDALSGHDRVVVLRAHQRLASHFQARVYEDIASISEHLHQIEDDFEAAEHGAAAEVALALRLTRRAAESDMGLAIDLRRRLPRVWEAFSEGNIDLRRARVIVSGVTHLPEDTAREVVDRVIDHAPRLTTGQLAARIARACMDTDAAQARDRYERAVEDRRVVVEAGPDGTAHLMGLDLPPDLVAAATNRIDRLARSLRTSTETRSMDQLRADVLMDLLCGDVTGSGGTVDIRVDLDTLTLLAEHPGELAGFGPVIADIARQVADQQRRAEWSFTVTDPDSGRPVHTGTTRRRPTAAQRRAVRALYPVCVFPGCRMPATSSDLDHRVPWARSHETRTDRLAPVCRHHHGVRHLIGWTYDRLPNGDHVWTTPLGHRYTTSGIPP